MFIMEFHQMFARLHYELYIIIIILGYKRASSVRKESTVLFLHAYTASTSCQYINKAH